MELFSEEGARECDVVFLAVDGDFSLKHAENICAGEEGPVVIDNSVSVKLLYAQHVVFASFSVHKLLLFVGLLKDSTSLA